MMIVIPDGCRPCVLLIAATLAGCGAQPLGASAPTVFRPNTTTHMADASPDLRVGNWRGTLTQSGWGTYSLIIHVRSSSGSQIAGVTHIQLGSEWAVMSFTGTAVRGTVSYQETQILKQHGGNWCIKSATLHYRQKRAVLKGPWTAPGCTPGEIRVRRQSRG
jgi:hypothetical protein